MGASGKWIGVFFFVSVILHLGLIETWLSLSGELCLFVHLQLSFAIHLWQPFLRLEAKPSKSLQNLGPERIPFKVQ